MGNAFIWIYNPPIKYRPEGSNIYKNNVEPKNFMIQPTQLLAVVVVKMHSVCSNVRADARIRLDNLNESLTKFKSPSLSKTTP